MIESMKKITVIVKSPWKDEVLDTLGELGIVHLYATGAATSAKIEELKEKTEVVQNALFLVPEEFCTNNGAIPVVEQDGLTIAQQLLSLTDTVKRLEEEIQLRKGEYDTAKIWGDFDPKDIADLRNNGVAVRFFTCPEKQLPDFHNNAPMYVIGRQGAEVVVALFTTDNEPALTFPEIQPPSRSLTEIHAEIEQLTGTVAENKQHIANLFHLAPVMKETLRTYTNLLAYEEAKAGMGGEETISYLVGFCPDVMVKTLSAVAKKKQWGLVVEQPGDQDPVPTLIHHSSWAKLHQPIMHFLGITPGYRGYDTNGLFLVFFSVFFALLIGDAGYGMLMFCATFILDKAGKSTSKERSRLFYLLSITTIVWGTLTGTWFGAKSLSNLPVLQQMAVPALSTYAESGEANIMHLCFVIGALQLSIAHCWGAIRAYPSLRAVGEAGWATLVWGIYYLAMVLVLNKAMSSLGLSLLIIGIALIVIFGEQKEDSILRGITRGLARFPLNLLTGVGSLSDLISYVRLFAVGLATSEMAAAFNGMAHGVIGLKSFWSPFLVLVIVLFGHAINLLLAAMAVLVHGVRLNLLECSRHLNVQWSGIPYRPFETESKNCLSKKGEPPWGYWNTLKT